VAGFPSGYLSVLPCIKGVQLHRCSRRWALMAYLQVTRVHLLLNKLIFQESTSLLHFGQTVSELKQAAALLVFELWSTRRPSTNPGYAVHVFRSAFETRDNRLGRRSQAQVPTPAPPTITLNATVPPHWHISLSVPRSLSATVSQCHLSATVSQCHLSQCHGRHLSQCHGSLSSTGACSATSAWARRAVTDSVAEPVPATESC
jgi:hypothetical protein